MSTISSVKQDAESKMEKSLESLLKEFSKLRTGRAHPSLLSGINVSYYGQPTPMSQVATITVSDPRTITVTPFEKDMVAVIDKTIRESDLGLNPAVAGMVIRIPLPPLTEDRRKALAKQMKQIAEQARVSVRNVRRDANTQLKGMTKAKEISEDEDKRAQDEVQKLTDKFIKDIDSHAVAKEADLMKV